MKRVPREVSWTKLRSGGESAQRAVDRAGRVLVTRHGEPAAVLMSTAAFERMERERGILLTLLRGELDIHAGRTQAWTDVLREARKRYGAGGKRSA